MKKLSLFIIVLIVITIFIYCEKNPTNGNNNVIKNDIEGIYTLKRETNNSISLYYSDFDSVEFMKIYEFKEEDEVRKIFLIKEKRIIVTASQTKLNFFDLNINIKISELLIPDALPWGYNDIWTNTLEVYYCNRETDAFIFVNNHSVFLIDLNSLNIRQKIWDTESNNVYISRSLFHVNQDKIFFILSYLPGVYEKSHELCLFNLESAKKEEIYNYPEYYFSLHNIFSNEEFLFSYDPALQIVLKFSLYDYAKIDSFNINQDVNLWHPLSINDHILLQDVNTSNFYVLNTEENRIDSYMILNSQKTRNTNYLKIKGGDLYSAFISLQDNKCFLVNLTKKNIVK